MVNALAVVLANLDEAIIGLLSERIASTAYDRKFGSYTSAPFTIPFAVGEFKKVMPYDLLVPSFWLGFDKAAFPGVEVRQCPVLDQEDNVPDHFYSLDIRVSEGLRSQWLSIEREVLLPPGADRYIVSLAMKAKASPAVSVNVELSIPLEDGGERRVHFARETIGPDYEVIFQHKPIELAPGDKVSLTSPPKLLVFLPCNMAYEISLAYMYVLASAGK